MKKSKTEKSKKKTEKIKKEKLRIPSFVELFVKTAIVLFSAAFIACLIGLIDLGTEEFLAFFF